jgi:hypothetical protein
LNAPRSAAAAGDSFPYRSKTTCYVEVRAKGAVSWGVDGGTYARALDGTSILYAVWPGEWSSALFVIDDLDNYARALGLVRDEQRTGLADHVHEIEWAKSPYGEASSGYTLVDVVLNCGCRVHDIRAVR